MNGFSKFVQFKNFKMVIIYGTIKCIQPWTLGVPYHQLSAIYFIFSKRECLSGTYGQGCLNTCSGHCLNSATCNRTTGSCDQGCQAGYIGKLCEEGFKFLFVNYIFINIKKLNWVFCCEKRYTVLIIFQLARIQMKSLLTAMRHFTSLDYHS